MSRFWIILLLLAGCPDVEEPTSGRVVDRLRGEPVAGARVRAGDAFAWTDADGRFVLAAAAGARVRVEAAGFLALERALGGEALRLFPAVTSEADDERLSLRRQAEKRGEKPAPADLTARALDISARLARGELVRAAPVDVPVPQSIRVWRRRVDGSTSSCSGRVDVIPFDQYVKGVLPHEWIPSWDPRALEMGAVAIRTYAAAWVAEGGKYDCADLDDTTASQVYEDETLPKTDAAVDATADVVVVREGALVFAEYSAENGDPTAFDVAEPHCAGKEVFGHGRGTCQWGTQRWATREGKDFVWMAAHYYPGAEAQLVEEATPDAGVPDADVADAAPPTPSDDDAEPGVDAAPPALEGELEFEGGCGCRSTTAAVPRVVWILGLLAAAVAGFGRRRRID